MTKIRALASAASLALMIILAGCGSSHTDAAAQQSALASAGASLTANPQFQTDKARLEANMRKDFHPTHPFKSVTAVLTETFPGADIKALVIYGIETFKPAARHAGQARTAWENGVVTYALQQSAQGVKGQPLIPGVTSSASPTAKPSH